MIVVVSTIPWRARANPNTTKHECILLLMKDI